MFETHPQAAMAKLPFSAPEVQDWSAVTQSIDSPWFRLVCCQRDSAEEDWAAEIRFVGYVPLLLAHLSADDPDFYVKEALISVPAWLSGLRHCQFMPLIKIVTYRSAEGGASHYGYEVEGGVRYPLNVDWSRAEVEVLYDSGVEGREF